jgi:8-oxo-dGTP diphosphatase
MLPLPTPPDIRIRVAAIILKEDRLLMVRHEKGNKRYWMLPGGGVDPCETLTGALARELREELCVDVAVRDLVMVNDSIAPDHHRHILNLYFTAELLAGTPVVGDDPRIVEVHFQPVDTLHTLAMYPDFALVLQQQIRQGFPHKAWYGGNLWKD